jgi:two-component system heavy metal sensor histidine kinase CusS
VIELRARVERGEGQGAGPDAVLEVVNEGEPVPAELLPRLFDRFFRADPARAGDARGSGLGLSLVRAVMTLHGGSARVWQDVESHIGFELRLPAPQGQHGPPGPQAGEVAG